MSFDKLSAMLSRRLTGGDDWRERFASHVAAAPNGRLKAFYQCKLLAANCPLREVPMVSIDLETTGLDPDRDSIVSIGMITMDTDRIHCRGARHWTFKPDRTLSSTSVNIHAITHSAVDRYRAWRAVSKTSWMCWPARSWSRTSRPSSAGSWKKPRGPSPDILCSSPSSTPWSSSGGTTRRDCGGFSPGSIHSGSTPAAAAVSTPRYKAHHALTDALTTAELLQAQIAHRYEPTDPVWRFWR